MKLFLVIILLLLLLSVFSCTKEYTLDKCKFDCENSKEQYCLFQCCLEKGC